MPRWLARTLRYLAAAIAAPIVAALLLYLLSDTSPGRWTIERLVWLFSGEQVRITGLGGTFPNALTAAHVQIRDREGAWLLLNGVAIEWAPYGFLHDDVKIASVRVAQARLLRFPVPEPSSTGPGTTRYEVASLSIARADFAKELTGRAISIAVSGHGHYTSDADAAWTIRAGNAAGTYASDGVIDGKRISATLSAREPVHGLLASLAGLPDLGALVIDARIDGPRGAEVLAATIDGGPARIRATGALDLVGRGAQLHVTAHAPAMTPRPGVAWSAFDFDGDVNGAFAKPVVAGHLRIADPKAAGGGASAITGTLSGQAGLVKLDGEADGVRLPRSDALAASPLKVSVAVRLDGPAPVLDMTASHPLLSFTAHTVFAERTTANVSLKLERISPFASLAGVDLDGGAVLTAQADLADTGNRFTLNGTIDAAGASLPARLIGRGAHIALVASTDDTGFAVDKAHIAGPVLKLDASGSERAGIVDVSWQGSLADISRLVSTGTGTLALQGRLKGRTKSLSLTATAQGDVATRGYARGPVSVTLDAQGLPNAPNGSLTAQGRINSAPLHLATSFAPQARATRVTLRTLEWRSVRANGDFLVPGDFRAATGKTEFHIGQLGDIGLLIGQSLKGAVHGTLAIASDHGRLMSRIDAQANGLGIPGANAESLNVAGRIGDPFGKPDLALTLKAGGLTASGMSGSGDLEANGPLGALTVVLRSELANGNDKIPLAADATVDVDHRTATLARLETRYRDEPFRLAAPARIDFARGFAVDQMRLMSNAVEIRVAGRLAPDLDAEVALSNATPDFLRIVVPSLDAEGSLSGDATLGGTLAAPTGPFKAEAIGLHMRGAASGLPPAHVSANGTLHGKSVTLTAHIDAGKTGHLALDGTAPLSAGGTFDLGAVGTVDLAVFDPVLAANGRRIRGLVAIDGRLGGTLDNPRASGSAVLTNGEVADYLQGVRVNAISARLEAKGDTITISQLSGRAGNGTVSGSGTIALWASGIPLDLAITLEHARPLATDQFTANVDALLKLKGKLSDRLALSGSVLVNRGTINIAEAYPAQVAELDVRHSRTAPAPKPPPPPLAIGLDLTVRAENELSIRGHGLDALAGGSMTVRGSSNAPVILGGFTMRRGDLTLAGQTLTFTSGKITFDGRSLNGGFDPALDFEAQTNSASVVAKLTVGGHASTPKITLSSTPSLPQDEVLARLLFARSVSQLSPLELAQIAQAFAALGGIGSGFNPLGLARKTLGLDRLAVGSSLTGTGATIEAGKNIGHNIYVGAKQDTGGGTQAVVQVDLTEHLKLQSTLTAVPSAITTTQAGTRIENGDSIGLSYQFEY